MCSALFKCENILKIGWENQCIVLKCTQMRAHVENVDVLGWTKSDVFHMISFYIINFLFICCLRFKFGCFNVFANSVVSACLFNPLLKLCADFRKMLLVFIEFLWKKNCYFFHHFDIVWEAHCSWFDINQLISNLIWLFMLLYP